MRNRTELRAALRKVTLVRRTASLFTGVMCRECKSYARVINIGKGRAGGTQVICSNDNRHRR